MMSAGGQIRTPLWISRVGCGASASKSTRPHFREKEIDDAVLASLTHQTLKELGVAAVGHRLRLLNAIGLVRTDAKAKAGLQFCRSSTRVWGGGKMAQPIQIILMR